MSDENCPVWQRLLDSVQDKQLTHAEEHAKLLAGLNYQVQNGGWEQWVGNGYAAGGGGHDLERVLTAIGQPRATEVVGMLRKVLRHVDCKLMDGGCMGNYLRDKSEGGERKFNKTCEPLNTAYYAINDEFMAECEAYLAALPPGDQIHESGEYDVVVRVCWPPDELLGRRSPDEADNNRWVGRWEGRTRYNTRELRRLIAEQIIKITAAPTKPPGPRMYSQTETDAHAATCDEATAQYTWCDEVLPEPDHCVSIMDMDGDAVNALENMVSEFGGTTRRIPCAANAASLWVWKGDKDGM